MRLIDADVLKRRAQKVATESWKMKIEAKVETVLNQFIDWIDEAQTIEPEPQWAPCSDGLPEEGHDVLITKEPFKIKGFEQEVIKAKRSSDPRSGKIEWWSPEFGTLTDKTVLAWMPLPEPYKKVKK